LAFPEFHEAGGKDIPAADFQAFGQFSGAFYKYFNKTKFSNETNRGSSFENMIECIGNNALKNKKIIEYAAANPRDGDEMLYNRIIDFEKRKDKSLKYMFVNFEKWMHEL
jgi:hypothetical protein